MKKQLDQAKHDMNRQRIQLDSLTAKVEVLKATIEDFNSERVALLKEKEKLFGEYTKLKSFIPEFELMEKSDNKNKYLSSMREQQSKESFLDYLYTYSHVLIGQ